MVVVVVVVVVVVSTEVLLDFVRRQTLVFLELVHVKRPAVVVRTLPTFLQVVPAILGTIAAGAVAVSGADTAADGVAVGDS